MGARKTSVEALVSAGLGRVADNQLAKAFGVSRERIRQIRVSLELPRAALTDSRPGEAAQLLAGGIVVADVAAQFNVTAATVRNWARKSGVSPSGVQTEIETSALADVDWTRPTIDLAAEWDLSSQDVSKLRAKARRLGIDAARLNPGRKGYNIEEYRRAGIGVDVDRIVAARLGVCPNTVSQVRRNHGIPAVGRRAALRSTLEAA